MYLVIPDLIQEGGDLVSPYVRHNSCNQISGDKLASPVAWLLLLNGLELKVNDLVMKTCCAGIVDTLVRMLQEQKSTYVY